MACGDEKTIVSEVGLWLMVNNIPYQKYDKLSVQLKKVLRNQICEPTHPTTARERADLYKELCMPEIGRCSSDTDDLIPPDEKLKKLFAPLSSTETSFKTSFWKEI